MKDIFSIYCLSTKYKKRLKNYCSKRIIYYGEFSATYVDLYYYVIISMLKLINDN